MGGLSENLDPAISAFFAALDKMGCSDGVIEEAVGLTRFTIGKYRRGRQPSLSTLRAMLTAVGLNIEITTYMDKDKHHYEYAH